MNIDDDLRVSSGDQRVWFKIYGGAIVRLNDGRAKAGQAGPQRTMGDVIGVKGIHRSDQLARRLDAPCFRNSSRLKKTRIFCVSFF